MDSSIESDLQIASFSDFLETDSSSDESECESDSSFEMGFISSSSLNSDSSNASSKQFYSSNLDNASTSGKNKMYDRIKYNVTDTKDSVTENIRKTLGDEHKLGAQNIYSSTSQTANSCAKISKPLDPNLLHSFEFNAVCSVCGESFPSSTALDVHKLDHFISESYACEICNHICKNKEDYALHFQIHDQSNVVATNTLRKKKRIDIAYACEVCGQKFKFSSSYERHMIKHNTMFTCSICNATFQSKLLCHQHKLKHAKRKINKCKHCNKLFQRAHQLTLHMQVHNNEKKYHCMECDLTYSYKTSLMRHMMKYHAPDSPKFQCDVCGELFKTKKMLSCHTILHSTNKVIKCSECSQTFKYRSSLQRHLFLHRSSKPFRCYNCGKSFKTENLLKIHKALHVANEKFVCKICDKSFAFESFLNNHLLLHTD